MTIRDRLAHPHPIFRKAMAFLVPVCMARNRRRGKSRRVSKKGKITRPATTNRLPDANLVTQFREDVKEPLAPGKTRKNDDTPFSIDLPWKSWDVNKIRDMKREEVLDLLIRASWIGIGVLVGCFLVVHLVIVHDFLPG